MTYAVTSKLDPVDEPAGVLRTSSQRTNPMIATVILRHALIAA